MYKEMVGVIDEFIKNDFHKIPRIRDFLLHIVLRDYHNIANSLTLGENTMMDFIKTFLHSDHFAFFTRDLLHISTLRVYRLLHLAQYLNFAKA